MPGAAAAAPVGERSPSRPNPWSKRYASAPVSNGGTGEVRLARAGDGHFHSHAAIGSATVRVVIDTGASVIALTGADARAIGLTWDASEIRPVGRGASGPVNGVVRRLPRVDVGGIVV
ncbi:MAG: TIGR02281 family clan AA aspartic protease, partial [Hyphomicrobiales bacterium]